jgi:hypothetical protein
VLSSLIVAESEAFKEIAFNLLFSDAERAMSKLQNTDFKGVDLKLGWGKAVPNIQLQSPLYVPDRLKWLLTPPKQSNLPLNAQPPPDVINPQSEDELHKCTGQ